MSEADAVVFVVDDDPAIGDALTSLLRSVGLTVETFGSAQDFLNRPPPDGPGCLVLDVRLPGLSGLDLQRALATTQMTLPIIFLTGYGDIPMTVRAMKSRDRGVFHQYGSERPRRGGRPCISATRRH
jgi:FixJ family two-component response regulator